MRAWLLALGLVLVASGCASPLRLHGEIANAAATALDVAGAAVDRAKHVELKAIRTTVSDVPRVEREAELHAKYAPIDRGHETVRIALSAYYRSLARAVADGKTTLDLRPVTALLGTWRALVEIGRVYELELPRPMRVLEELAAKEQTQ